jgi:hypothetical protein
MVDGGRYNLSPSGLCAVERSRGPGPDYDYDYDYEYAHEHEFSALCVAYGGRLSCGQVNVTIFQLSYPQLFAKFYLQRCSLRSCIS